MFSNAFFVSPQAQKSVVSKTRAHSDNVLAALKNAHQSAVHQSREQLEGILKEKQNRVAAADREFEAENTKHAQVLAVRQRFYIISVYLPGQSRFVLRNDLVVYFYSNL